MFSLIAQNLRTDLAGNEGMVFVAIASLVIFLAH